MKVSIVIPNWNGAEKLKKNLPKVLEVAGVDEIIVCDDASSDGSVELMEKDFPQVKLLKSNFPRNQGFASNVNKGVKFASGDLVFLLNSDAIPNQDCVLNVLDHFKKAEVFSVGCNTGGSWAWAKFENGFFWHGQAKIVPKEAHQTLWASGGSGVFRKSLWDELGGLDSLFNPFYEEDLDIGYRATKRGFVNFWEPNAKVEHEKGEGVIAENFSQTAVSKTAQRNQLIFIWKNMTDSDLIREHIWVLIKILITRPGFWLVFLSAFKNIRKILDERGLEKKQAKITDREILNKFSLT